MVFNSLTFLAFFAVVLVVHHLPLRWSVRKLNLLLASYLFYAAWNPPFVVLLVLSAVVDFFLARAIGGMPRIGRRRALLGISLFLNLGLLAYFKYGQFALDNFVHLLAIAGVHYRPPRQDILLPLGISFYTFETISYLVDVYRGRLKPWHSFVDYALFLTFFPHLVAGPIVRAGDFLPQCLTPKRATADQMGWGLSLMVLGLFEKVVLADGILAPAADAVFNGAARAHFVDAWVGTLAFSGQIFCDFAGYSTCGIGAALCLGFVLKDNFRFPYAAVGFSDFWQRWHISLSSWLRDYLYIPLGGNRRGRILTYRNLMLTMLLGGLWHGAAWHFVAWGGLHGSFLAAERFVKARWPRKEVRATPALRYAGVVAGEAGGWKMEDGTSIIPPSSIFELPSSPAEPPPRPSPGVPEEGVKTAVRYMVALLTFLLVSVAWVLFRAKDLAAAWQVVRRMFVPSMGRSLTTRYELVMVLGLTVVLLSVHWFGRDSSLRQAIGRFPWWLRSIGLAAAIVCLVLAPGDDRAFIYFQF